MNIPSHNKQYELQLNKAYNNCIRFLVPRPRSIRETKNYLRKKNFPDSIIEKTINKLIKEDLLNDKTFACMFVENREKFRPRSKFALICELKAKGIDENIIDNAIKNIDEMKSAIAAIEPKLRIWQNYSNKDLSKKIFNFLKNRGFSYEISSSVCEQYCMSTDTSNKPLY